MVKNVFVSLDDNEYERLSKLKGNRTWREVLIDGAEKKGVTFTEKELQIIQGWKDAVLEEWGDFTDVDKIDLADRIEKLLKGGAETE